MKWEEEGEKKEKLELRHFGIVDKSTLNLPNVTKLAFIGMMGLFLEVLRVSCHCYNEIGLDTVGSPLSLTRCWRLI